jgi:hypothetical protein
MDEKTAELRDIFMDVAEEGTVTERQEETHGSLAGADDEAIDDRLTVAVARMRDRYEFDTDLTDGQLTSVVRGFYQGDDDPDLAEELGVSTETVFRARMDLHLIREADLDAPFDLGELRTRFADGASTETVASEIGVQPAELRPYRRVIDAQTEARSASHRFQTEFEDILAEVDLSIQLTESVTEDGLEEATDDIETDVSF